MWVPRNRKNHRCSAAGRSGGFGSARQGHLRTAARGVGDGRADRQPARPLPPRRLPTSTPRWAGRPSRSPAAARSSSMPRSSATSPLLASRGSDSVTTSGRSLAARRLSGRCGSALTPPGSGSARLTAAPSVTSPISTTVRPTAAVCWTPGWPAPAPPSRTTSSRTDPAQVPSEQPAAAGPDRAPAEHDIKSRTSHRVEPARTRNSELDCETKVYGEHMSEATAPKDLAAIQLRTMFSPRLSNMLGREGDLHPCRFGDLHPPRPELSSSLRRRHDRHDRRSVGRARPAPGQARASPAHPARRVRHVLEQRDQLLALIKRIADSVSTVEGLCDIDTTLGDMDTKPTVRQAATTYHRNNRR